MNDDSIVTHTYCYVLSVLLTGQKKKRKKKEKKYVERKSTDTVSLGLVNLDQTHTVLNLKQMNKFALTFIL